MALGRVVSIRTKEKRNFLECFQSDFDKNWNHELYTTKLKIVEIEKLKGIRFGNSTIKSTSRFKLYAYPKNSNPRYSNNI